MKYTRKTRDIYMLYIDYGYGWDWVATEEDIAEAKRTRRNYKTNQPQYPSKIVKRRIKIK